MSNKILKIFFSESHINPREDCDNFAKMIFLHSRYQLGDSKPLDILSEDIMNHPKFNYFTSNQYNFNDPRELLEYAKKLDLFAVFQEVYFYEHGNIAISTTPYQCRWDSGMAGFMYVTKDDIRNNWNIKRVTQKYLDKAKDLMMAEFDTQKSFVQGDTYGFAIFEEQEDGSIECTDTCHGFIGDNYETNGLLDYVDDDLHEELARIFQEYDICTYSEAMETEKEAEDVLEY